jgi:tetratricopeptide (TPR) repeat protein
VYTALPITLNFARHQLSEMGDFEASCRQRFNKYAAQMSLQQSEVHRFVARFERYGIEDENQKKAAILCSRGQSEMFAGNTDRADEIFKQARDLAPNSGYVYAMSASYELARNRVGLALQYAEAACDLATKREAALCHMILARVLRVQGDKAGRVRAIEKALGYDPDDVIVRHQYGVALSWAGRTQEAIAQFDRIIEQEKARVPLTETLLMAIKTRVINLRRLGRNEEAERDIRFAEDVLTSNPHLQHQARHIYELKEG